MIQFPMWRIAVTAPFGIYSPFGAKTMHYAIDISNTQPKGYDVMAAHDGVVVFSVYDSAGGNMIAVQGYFNESCDILTRYAHLKNRNVKQGEIVSRGTVLGAQGNTGTATTFQHLHFETWLVPKNYVYKYGDRSKYAVDPLSICQLLDDQIFLVDDTTRNLNALPYPEPKLENMRTIQGTVKIHNGNVNLRFLPYTDYPNLVSGYNRNRNVLSDFFTIDEFAATNICSTVGRDGLQNDWALIDTTLGQWWVALIDGYTELLMATPIIPESDSIVALKKEIENLKSDIDHKQQALSKYIIFIDSIIENASTLPRD